MIPFSSQPTMRARLELASMMTPFSDMHSPSKVDSARMRKRVSLSRRASSVCWCSDISCCSLALLSRQFRSLSPDAGYAAEQVVGQEAHGNGGQEENGR